MTMTHLRLWRPQLIAPRPTMQHRTFLGLQRTPPPQPHIMGYLVAQGLAVVVLGDLAIAALRGEPSTTRLFCQAAGFWRDPPKFGEVHGAEGETRVKG